MVINRKQVFSIITTIVILFLLFSKGNFSELYDVLIELDVTFLFLSVLSYIIFTNLIGFRFYFLLDKKVSLYKVLKCHFGSMLLSDVTPGRLGYFSIVHHLKDKVAMEESTNYVLLGQLNDFLNKFLAIIIFSYLLSSTVIEKETIKFVMLFTLFCLFLLIAFTYGIGFQYISERINSSNKILIFFDKVKNYAVYDSSKILRFVFITTIAWVSLGFFWYFSALSLGIDNFSVFYHMILHGLSSVLSFLPFVLGGIGLQEATLVTILTIEGINYDLALAFAVLTRGINIIIDLIIGIKYVWGV